MQLKEIIYLHYIKKENVYKNIPMMNENQTKQMNGSNLTKKEEYMDYGLSALMHLYEVSAYVIQQHG